MEFNVPEKGKDRKKGSRRPEQKLPGWREHLYLYDLHAFQPSSIYYVSVVLNQVSVILNYVSAVLRKIPPRFRQYFLL
jgi:hypothetical protein